MRTLNILLVSTIVASRCASCWAEVTITKQPVSQVVSLGAYVTNHVAATSTAPPLTYQWYGKGVLLAGETKRICVVNKVTAADAGNYYVVVSDAENQPVQSDTATISVDPMFIKITSGPLVTDMEPTESATWFDYDNDGWLDVCVNRYAPAGPGLPQSLYHNNQDGTFSKITNNALAQTQKRGTTSAVGDYDNDGDQDIYVSSNASQGTMEPRCDLFRNDGQGAFTALAGQPWTRDADSSFGPTFVDFDRDGFLDILVANVSGQPPCLYHQTVGGTFTKLTEVQAGSVLLAANHGYDCSWADYDNDGDPDVWVEDALGLSRLHENDGHGFFSLVTSDLFLPSGAGGAGLWGDYDNDGFLDLFVGGYTEAGTYVNALYHNRAGQDFTDVAATAGVALQMSAWAAAWGDYDNDGWLDLFIADAFGDVSNILFRNSGDGTFESADVGSPVRDGGSVRFGVRWADYDNDGLLDLFLVCGTANVPLRNHLYRNNGANIGNTNHWLKVKLNGQASNRSGIGAKIRVKATIGGKEIWQVREMAENGNSQTCPGLIAHFGLGDAAQADVLRVEWPSGNMQESTDVPAGQTGQAPMTITEQVFITPVRPSSSLSGAVTLTSSLSGATAWQWYHDGAAIAGQTGRNLPLSNITTNDAGRYSVAVTTATGTFTNHVYLLVDTQFERIEMGTTGASWGCAWGDYNNDGYPDLVIAQNNQSVPAACELYRNNRDGTFLKVTPDEAGDIVRLARSWQHVTWGDIDNDGDLDLIVSDNPTTGEPQAALWRNLGNGRFEDATAAGSFLTDRLWCMPVWADLNCDGLLDLAVANAWDEPPSWPDWSRNLLYFNRGGGRFRKETQDPFVSYRAQAMNEGLAVGDIEGDGDPDLLVGSHSGVLLFDNDGAGKFVRAPFPSVAGGKPLSPSLADYDNDGKLDVFIGVYAWTDTYFHRLLRNAGGGQWTSMPLGLSVESGGGSWADYDNDGDLDLFISRGRIVTTNNLFYSNNGDGTFTQVTLGSPANDEGRSRTSAWADCDNNGFLDLLVTGRDGFPDVLYRNHGNSNHWISLKLVGTASNRSAIGAKVRVQATIFGKTFWQMRELGTGNLAQNDLRPHFGLGDALRATTVRIEWPSGAVEEFSKLARDQFYTIVEPSLRGAMKPNGEFELTVTASTNRTCNLLASGDLFDWTTLTNLTGQGEVPVRIVDAEAPGQNQRYYQLK